MSAIEFQTSIQNGVIQIPKEYHQDLKDSDTIAVTIQTVSEEKKISSTGIIARLIKKPVPVKDFQPFNREDVHRRAL